MGVPAFFTQHAPQSAYCNCGCVDHQHGPQNECPPVVGESVVISNGRRYEVPVRRVDSDQWYETVDTIDND